MSPSNSWRITPHARTRAESAGTLERVNGRIGSARSCAGTSVTKKTSLPVLSMMFTVWFACRSCVGG
eukprot:4067538-Prymnesium_polylepis.1